MVLKKVSLTIIAAFISICGYSQIYLGLKAGGNATKSVFEDEETYNNFNESFFKPGFTAGGMFYIENKKRYGLCIEALYSVKGRKVESKANSYEKNSATYSYLDFPLLFRVNFPTRYFKWYLNAGPEVNYWLRGKGAFEVFDASRSVTTVYDYEVNFGEPKTSLDYLNVSEAERLQFSFAFGGGFIWELKSADYVSLDFRFSLGHTFMGDRAGSSIPNIGQTENFESTNNVISVSGVYYIDLMKKMTFWKNKYR
jgi:hypothetical protein